MTVEEAIALLEREHSSTEVYICHYAKRAGRRIPVIQPLISVEYLDGQLCLIEEDDRLRYLAGV